MNRNRQSVIGVVGLFIVLNGAIIWWRSSNSTPPPVRINRDEVIKRQQLQASTVAQWQSSPTSPFDEQSIRQALSKNHSDECCLLPTGATSVPVEKLSEEMKEDLEKALTDILLIYAQNDPGKLLSYMAARNESPTSKILDFAIDFLTEESQAQPGFKPTKEDPTALMLALWKGMRCNSHWSRLVDDGMCLTVWEMQEGNVPELQKGAPRKALFGNQATLTHHFAPPEQSSSSDSPHLIADLVVLVRHDQALKDLVAPYYFRFRFNRSDGKWHPLQLIYVDAAFDGADDDLVILF